jgi:serine/threonine protein kinase
MGHARIFDFSMSVLVGMISSEEPSIVSRVDYLAPERYHRQDISEYRAHTATDIYSLGTLFYLVVTAGLRLPFRTVGERSTGAVVAMKIMRGLRPRRPLPDECDGMECSDGFWTLLQACLSSGYRERPHASEVLRRLSLISDVEGLEI